MNQFPGTFEGLLMIDYLLPYPPSLTPLFGTQLSVPTSLERCYHNARNTDQKKVVSFQPLFLPPSLITISRLLWGSLCSDFSWLKCSPTEGEEPLRSHRKGELR